MKALKICLLTTKEILVKINTIWYHFHIFFKWTNSSGFQFFFSISVFDKDSFIGKNENFSDIYIPIYTVSDIYTHQETIQIISFTILLRIVKLLYLSFNKNTYS